MGYIRRIWLSFSVGVLWSSILQFGWIIIYNCCLILSWWMAWAHNISAGHSVFWAANVLFVEFTEGMEPGPLYGDQGHIWHTVLVKAQSQSVTWTSGIVWHVFTQGGPLSIIGICLDVSTCSGYGHKSRLLYYLNDSLIINGPFRCLMTPMSLVGGAL